MISRTALITGLLLVEGAIICEMVFVVRGQPDTWPPFRAEAAAASGPHLVEDGPARKFSLGSRPALNIDIGNADLTIRAVDRDDVSVSVSSDPDFGMFGAHSPISASADGDLMRIDTQSRGWSGGDDRMVTVEVPPQTRVSVIDAGDIKTEGLRSDSTFNSRHGHVKIQDFDAASLSITGNDKTISLNNVIAPHLNITTDDGDIDGTDVQARAGTIETNDGKVRLSFASGTDSLVNANTSDGKISAIGFDADTIKDEKNDDSDSDASAKSIRIGDGKGHFSVHTSDGDIELNQS